MGIFTDLSQQNSIIATAGEIASQNSATGLGQPVFGNNNTGATVNPQTAAFASGQAIDNEAAHRHFFQTPNPLMGGITPAEALKIYQGLSDVEYSHKNLFLIEVNDISGGKDIAETFNMFCTDVSYGPITIPSEREAIGSASMDKVKETEHVDMSITTLDDKQGSVKQWFYDKSGKVAYANGLVGLPIDYLVRIRVVHAFITDESSAGRGFEDVYLMRPVSLELEFSRREDALQELQLVFTQFDTFFPA